MSRTHKGSKGIGWEPWSNLKERQEQAADYSLEEFENPEPEEVDQDPTNERNLGESK